MTRRLRIAHVVVQPILVWDDGEELTPGPSLNPVTVPLSQVAHMVKTLPAEVGDLADRIFAAETTADEKTPSADSSDQAG